MSAKLDKLEQMVASLERAAGLRVDAEIVRQEEDGSWPQPKTNAPLVIGRKRFKGDPVAMLARRNAEIESEVQQLRAEQQRLRRTDIGLQITRLADGQSVGSASNPNGNAA